ncbi:coth protein-domain-containing protein, partial [Lobosporangium transversale]
YRYVHLSKDGKVKKQEKAARKLPDGALHTPNEFFDRKASIYNLPPLPQVFENKLEQNSPFFRQGYIGNLFVEGDPAQWKHLNKGGAEFYPEPIKVNVQYIGANDNIKINDVRFDLSGQSAREYAKLAYQLKFPKKNRLLDLSTLKLRSEETDATMMREKLYVDILNSLGVPAQQAAYVRLFFNGEPVGLYVAMEETKKHWIKKVLHPDIKNVKLGALWKLNSCCGHEANLEWLGPTSKSYVVGDIYKNILPGNNPADDPMHDLIQFMNDLKHYEPSKVQDPIAYWEQRLDLDGFLKSMAMEYLTGSWDSYWNSGSNYQFYNDPVTGKWTWLPTDFDDTFGTSYNGKMGSYRAIPKKNSKGFESPLAQKLIIETPQINARFEQILKDIVSYVFKPDALNPRLDAYQEMLAEDIAWDRAQPRLSKGKNHKFTAEDMSKDLENGAKGGWGLKKWIGQRSDGVQKDLKFQALQGSESRLPYHTMTKLHSAYGIDASQSKPQGEKEQEQKPKQEQDQGKGRGQQNGVSIEKARNQGDEKILNSAVALNGNWLALSTMLVVVVLAL